MYGYTSASESDNVGSHAFFMEKNNSCLDHLVLSVLETLPDILDKSIQALGSIFVSYEVSFILKYTGDIEMNVKTKSGLISIVQANGISKRCAIYPNNLHSSGMLAEKCNELFLKISDLEWISQDGNIRIRRQRVYGLFSFFSFELVIE